MKKIGSFLLKLTILFMVAFLIFFFWASSSNYSISEYEKLVNYEVPEPVRKDSIFRIATYNIGYLSGMTNNTSKERPRLLFDNNLFRVQEVLDTIDIDILALQEIDYESNRSHQVDQQAALASIGYPFAARAVNWDKRYVPFPQYPFSAHFGKVVSGQSILSKFPTSEHERVVLAKVENLKIWEAPFYLDRLAQISTISIEGTSVKVINVHTEAFDRPTRKKQLETLATLYKKYASDYPTFLLGDFNSDTNEEDLLKDLILNIHGIDLALEDLDQSTYPSILPKRRIDYIFYNKEFIEKVSARIIVEVEDASDHLPVMMTFRLKQ